ncbi:hypothetical protein FRC00_008705 [Tulasnella sp. 408]|nr:hypothetical protein FRC00_008705 [Tulasnella sp. 408]
MNKQRAGEMKQIRRVAMTKVRDVRKNRSVQVLKLVSKLKAIKNRSNDTYNQNLNQKRPMGLSLTDNAQQKP